MTETAKPAAAPGIPRLLRKDEVLATIGLGRSQLDEAVRRGAFPAPIHVTPGGRRVAWLAQEIEAHIEQQIIARKAST